MIWKIWKKSKLNSETICKNTEEKCEMIWRNMEEIQVELLNDIENMEER